jgi:NADP-dependent 3-hydroxy acid dehydrogenase YdfG
MHTWPGSIAVVTGAASGIGAALARALHEKGVEVAAADLDEAGLAALPRGIITIPLDVTDGAAVRDALEKTAADHGRLDFVFNNAGIFAAGNFEDMTDAAWQRIVDVNLWGVINGTRAAYDIMAAQGHGHIVNTASSAGVMPVARSAAYAATKHAVVGLTTSLRAEAKAHGVRASVVVPGLVDTAIFDRARDLTGSDYQKTLDTLPFRKVTPERAAAEILSGVERNQQFITFPRYNRVIWRLNRVLPDVMSGVINR